MDPLIGAALISGGFQLGGNLLSGLFGQSGAEEANIANFELLKFQQDWQREILLHKHQWETQDLKNAGLNPILSANSAGSIPGGGSYAPVQNTMAALSQGAASSAKQLGDLSYDLLRGMNKKGQAEASSADLERRFQEGTLNARIDSENARLKKEQYLSNSASDWFGRIMRRLGQTTSSAGKILGGGINIGGDK